MKVGSSDPVVGLWAERRGGCIELAKYYEQQVRVIQCNDWTQMAIEIQQACYIQI